MTDVPWPNIIIDRNSDNTQNVPLHEEYSFQDMAYLDSPQAFPLFDTQAKIIMAKQNKGIVDIGCRHGPVLEILINNGYSDFKYMGFDTSSEPIDIARERWRDYPNIEFRKGSWSNKDIFDVGFNVDQVIWSGVLLYRPKDHLDFFLSITKDFYNSANAIIQEPIKHQRHWRDDLVLNTIAEQLESYRPFCRVFKEIYLDLEIFSGKRIIADITM